MSSRKVLQDSQLRVQWGLRTSNRGLTARLGLAMPSGLAPGIGGRVKLLVLEALLLSAISSRCGSSFTKPRWAGWWKETEKIQTATSGQPLKIYRCAIYRTFSLLISTLPQPYTVSRYKHNVQTWYDIRALLLYFRWVGIPDNAIISCYLYDNSRLYFRIRWPFFRNICERSRSRIYINRIVEKVHSSCNNGIFDHCFFHFFFFFFFFFFFMGEREFSKNASWMSEVVSSWKWRLYYILSIL